MNITVPAPDLLSAPVPLTTLVRVKLLVRLMESVALLVMLPATEPVLSNSSVPALIVVPPV